MIKLRLATEADIPFIFATERRPGYDVVVGRFEEAEHRANLADSDWLYFVGEDDRGTPRGFAILQHRNTKDGSEFLRRIAVADAGQGFGRELLRALIDWVFMETDADRFALHVRKVNTRARHVYESLGFAADPSATPESDSGGMVLNRAIWTAR